MTTTAGQILMGHLSKDDPFAFSILWKIDGFLNKSRRLHSPRISLSGVPGEWNMWLDREEFPKHAFAFSIYLRYSPPPRSTLKLFDSPRGYIEVFGNSQRVIRRFHNVHSDNVWNSLHIVCEHCQVPTTATAKALFCNLYIHVDGLLLHEESPPTSALPDEMKRMSKLIGDPDVILIGNEEVEVTAHRRILSLKSRVFAAMFQQDMLEKKTGKVTIPDFSSDLIREMLHHVYTGKEPGQQVASSLLQAAEKYDLPDLKEMCEVHLARQLDTSNLQTTLDQAIAFNCSYLKKRCMEWTSDHI